MSEDQLLLLKQISNELSTLRHLKELELRDIIIREVERLASTSARKRMWTLCDGTIGSAEIARKIGVSARTVQYFFQDATRAGLISLDEKGRAGRKVEWVPSEWSRAESEGQLEPQGEERLQ